MQEYSQGVPAFFISHGFRGFYLCSVDFFSCLRQEIFFIIGI